MSQESGYRLTAFSAQSLTKPKLRYHLRVWSHLRLGVLVQVHEVGRIHFLAAIESTVACFLKANTSQLWTLLKGSPS